MSKIVACPNCGSSGMTPFYEIDDVPVHSVLLMPTQEKATSYPTGDIHLAFCSLCGFISNVAFNPELHEYSLRYEATQSYSPTFNRFHQDLAQSLIDRYDLQRKKIIEIGCGNGEFLILLCHLGDNTGIGFDPAYDESRIEHEAKKQITFIQDFYGEKYAKVAGDFVCCKMTLEHIPQTADFLSTVRRSIGDNLDTTVFFQIPNAGYVLDEVAFWDIYYEHCSYFTTASLTHLFLHTGFDVLNVFTEYDDQYLMIEARPSKSGFDKKENVDPLLVDQVKNKVNFFQSQIKERTKNWRTLLDDLHSRSQKVVIWGSGSKGVAFLTTLKVKDEIQFAVDINPHKHGTFMAGSGHKIVSPQFLAEYRPDVVIVMNPVYRDEIQKDLENMNLSPKMMSVQWA